jgi:hypothetical protein
MISLEAPNRAPASFDPRNPRRARLFSCDQAFDGASVAETHFEEQRASPSFPECFEPERAIESMGETTEPIHEG